MNSKPNALLLWYAVVDNGPDGYGSPEMKARFQEVSPLHNIGINAPAPLFLLGTKDKYVPVKTANLFKSLMERGGGRCELRLFPGAGHPLNEWRKGDSPLRDQVIATADDFLHELGFASTTVNGSKR